MSYRLHGKPVSQIEVAGIDPRDCPEYADAHVESAVWEDTGEPLSEDDLEQLTLDPVKVKAKDPDEAVKKVQEWINTGKLQTSQVEWSEPEYEDDSFDVTGDVD